MKKKIVVITLTLLVFLSTVLLGFATVFRVREVTLETSVISQAAESEARDLQKRLQEAYENDSMFFVDDESAKRVIAEFPYFRMSSFRKDYPNRVILEIEEDEEVYAVESPTETQTSYYVLSANGTVLAYRTDYNNRLDGEPNLLIKGLQVSGKKGQLLQGEIFSTVLTFCSYMSEQLGGLRDNLLEIEVSKYAPEYRITMREGVKIYVGSPTEMTKEKAQEAAKKYQGLADDEKLMGRIAVDSVGGQLLISYDRKDFTID